ncbi:alpha-tocopherol transfer protein-like [Polistes fuscatus]|uniref:alpha-tocopherol transfer protein-like n=1 Tax=Polistes fuscatus TaxID=30207 RepID=UPI001CA811A0|nr:alpha-tocopherol transfer protein-like [Polistes fuscatus]
MQNAPKLIVYGKELKLMFGYDDEFKKKAENELRETPEVMAESLKTIREMVKGDKDLFVPDLDEFFIKFLRPCKWYPNSAFALVSFFLIQRHYKFFINYPYMKENFTLMDLKNTFFSDLIVPIPVRCQDGSRLIIIHGGSKWKPREYYIYDMFKSLIFIFEQLIIEPATQIAGIQVILDMNGLPFSHVTHITPKLATTVADWIQRYVPYRLKNIHVINQSYIFNMIYAIFKPFLSEKLRNRIHFHGTNREKLINMVGEKALPKEYGGSDLFISPIEAFWQYIYYWSEEFEVRR